MSASLVARSAIHLTPNHILELIKLRPKRSIAAFVGGDTFSDVREGFEQLVGGELASTSSVVPGADPIDGRTRSYNCKTFKEALKCALSAVINAERSDRNRTMFLSNIAGNSQIDGGKTFYRVPVPRTAHVSVAAGYAIFAYSEDTKANPHPNYPVKYFDTKEAAYAAAVAFKRRLVSATGITFSTLPQRYQVVRDRPYFRIPLHSTINGLSLMKDKGSVWIHVEMFM